VVAYKQEFAKVPWIMQVTFMYIIEVLPDLDTKNVFISIQTCYTIIIIIIYF